MKTQPFLKRAALLFTNAQQHTVYTLSLLGSFSHLLSLANPSHSRIVHAMISLSKVPVLLYFCAYAVQWGFIPSSTLPSANDIVVA